MKDRKMIEKITKRVVVISFSLILVLGISYMDQAETQSGKLNIPTMKTKQFKVELFWITESFLNTKIAKELIFSKSNLFYYIDPEDVWKGKKRISPAFFIERLRNGYLILYVQYANISLEDAKWNNLGWPMDPLDIVDDEGNQYNSADEDIFDFPPAHILHPTATGVIIKLYKNKKDKTPKYTTIYYCPIGEGTEAFVKIPYQWEDLTEWRNFKHSLSISPITDKEKIHQAQEQIEKSAKQIKESTKELEKILNEGQ